MIFVYIAKIKLIVTEKRVLTMFQAMKDFSTANRLNLSGIAEISTMVLVQKWRTLRVLNALKMIILVLFTMGLNTISMKHCLRLRNFIKM